MVQNGAKCQAGAEAAAAAAAAAEEDMMAKGICPEAVAILKQPISSFKSSKEGSAELKTGMKLALRKQLLHEGRKPKASFLKTGHKIGGGTRPSPDSNSRQESLHVLALVMDGWFEYLDLGFRVSNFDLAGAVHASGAAVVAVRRLPAQAAGHEAGLADAAQGDAEPLSDLLLNLRACLALFRL